MLKRYIGRFEVVWKSYKQFNGFITLDIQAPLMLIVFFFSKFQKVLVSCDEFVRYNSEQP